MFLPHDARAKTLQTGRSIVEQFVTNGIYPEIVPNLDINDGIQSTRLIFPWVYFDTERTKDLIRALKSYHREYDEDAKCFRDRPVHDWSSHFADAYRYFSLVAQRRTIAPPLTPEQWLKKQREEMAHGAHYAFTLDELFTENERYIRHG